MQISILIKFEYVAIKLPLTSLPKNVNLIFGQLLYALYFCSFDLTVKNESHIVYSFDNFVRNYLSSVCFDECIRAGGLALTDQNIAEINKIG